MSAALKLAMMALVSADSSPQTIRIWGPPAMAGIVSRWTAAYSRTHPNVSFELVMKGSDTAVPGLYSGRADIALMGRQNDSVDDNGFSRSMEYPLTRLAVTSGSLSTPGKSDALAVLVRRDNPLRGLTIAQLGAVLDCGADAPRKTVKRWGELGLHGSWADKPIHIYTYDLATRTGVFLQHVVTADRRRMCWDRVSEYADARRLDGTRETAAEQIGAAARADPYALGIANEAEAAEGLKLIALSPGAGEPFILPTSATVSDQRYPLARRTYAFINRRPGQAASPKVAAFLRYVLSPAGQSMLASDRGYLPLYPQSLAASREAVGGK
jgi:phosphate transport system substrate-binding protein